MLISLIGLMAIHPIAMVQHAHLIPEQSATKTTNGPTHTSHSGAISNKNNGRLDIYNSGRIEHAFNKDMAPINGKAMVNVNSPHDSTKLDDHPIDNCEPANTTCPNNSANVDRNLASSNNTRKGGSNQHNINATATTNQHVDDHNFKAYNSKTARHDKPLITSQQITFRRRATTQQPARHERKSASPFQLDVIAPTTQFPSNSERRDHSNQTPVTNFTRQSATSQAAN
uniref:Secreted protein n=1 Tax=Globodera pallida TaxID=36090 RepID=A0A183BZY7_GLOPA